MKKLARDVMTPDPACCRPHTPLDQVAKMVQSNCGEIPVLDVNDRPIRRCAEVGRRVHCANVRRSSSVSNKGL